MTRRAIRLLAAGTVLCLAACAASISRQDLVRRMEGEAPVLVIDVRTEREYAEGHIPGAMHISVFDGFRSRVAGLGYPSEGPVVLVCEHGPRAGLAGVLLRLSGYGSVYNLEGAMKEWKKNGLPMEK